MKNSSALSRYWRAIVDFWRFPPQDLPWKILFRMRIKARRIGDILGSSRMSDFMKRAFRNRSVDTEIQVQHGQSKWEHKTSRKIFY